MYSLMTFILLMNIFSPRVTYAQDFTYEKSYQDYVFTQSKYNEAFSEYQKARDSYTKNSTLSLKEIAREKTYSMLISREELLNVYLTTVKMRVFENKGLDNTDKQSQMSKIDTEIEWLKNQKSKYKSDDTLEDLFNKSKETESRYKTNTGVVIYEALFNITKGDLADNKNTNLTIYKDLKSYIEKGVSENKFRIDPFNRWFSDIENIEKEINKNEATAKEKIQKLSGGNNAPANAFNTSVAILESNIPLLSQLNNYTFELLNAIRAQIKLSK